MRPRAILFAALLLVVETASAHRLSPAYFGLHETAPNEFEAKWKVSISGGLADALEPRLPDQCTVAASTRSFVVADARLVLADVECDGGLAGKRFRIDGLSATATDVLLRVDYLDGTSFTHRLVPRAPAVTIPAAPSGFAVAATYLSLGIQHILRGVDHLLFVLALLLLVGDVRRLIATVTAFTVAHSITLGVAALGYVSAPSGPVEACIALSILFVAAELARRDLAGDSEAKQDLATRFPWLVAFAFGLLHGFGFAGALNEIGLPAGAIAVALLFFNVGVEVGQLAFIAAVLAIGWMLGIRPGAVPKPILRPVVYTIGCVSAFWFIQRSLSAI